GPGPGRRRPGGLGPRRPAGAALGTRREAAPVLLGPGGAVAQAGADFPRAAPLRDAPLPLPDRAAPDRQGQAPAGTDPARPGERHGRHPPTDRLPARDDPALRGGLRGRAAASRFRPVLRDRPEAVRPVPAVRRLAGDLWRRGLALSAGGRLRGRAPARRPGVGALLQTACKQPREVGFRLPRRARAPDNGPGSGKRPPPACAPRLLPDTANPGAVGLTP